MPSYWDSNGRLVDGYYETMLTGSNVDLKGYHKKLKNNLKFTRVIESGITQIAFSYNCDKYLYYITGINVLKRISNVEPVNPETIVALNGLTGTIQNVYVLPENKLIVITRDYPGTTFGIVYYYSSFIAAPVEVLRTNVGYFSIAKDVSMDILNPLVLVGEYAHNGTSKKLYKSTNYTTFTEIKATVVNGVNNSHWHAVAYDEYTGWIWAAHGDEGTQGIHVSKDVGTTWTLINSTEQPTLIIPMRDRVVLGRDARVPGFDTIERSIDSNLNKLKVEPLFSFQTGFLGVDNYPDANQCTVDGDTAFVIFPSKGIAGLPNHIVATFDGGKTWEIAYADNDQTILCPRIVLGDYLALLDGTNLVLSKIPTYSEFDEQTNGQKVQWITHIDTISVAAGGNTNVAKFSDVIDYDEIDVYVLCDQAYTISLRARKADGSIESTLPNITGTATTGTAAKFHSIESTNGNKLRFDSVNPVLINNGAVPATVKIMIRAYRTVAQPTEY